VQVCGHFWTAIAAKDYVQAANLLQLSSPAPPMKGPYTEYSKTLPSEQRKSFEDWVTTNLVSRVANKVLTELCTSSVPRILPKAKSKAEAKGKDKTPDLPAPVEKDRCPQADDCFNDEFLKVRSFNSCLLVEPGLLGLVITPHFTMSKLQAGSGTVRPAVR
jgi:hypothetical protein